MSELNLITARHAQTCIKAARVLADARERSEREILARKLETGSAWRAGGWDSRYAAAMVAAGKAELPW